MEGNEKGRGMVGKYKAGRSWEEAGGGGSSSYLFEMGETRACFHYGNLGQFSPSFVYATTLGVRVPWNLKPVGINRNNTTSRSTSPRQQENN